MSEERTYYIVNKHGIIYECTRKHAAWRLQQQGFRVPSAAELKEYLIRREQGFKRRTANAKAKPFMQLASSPIAEAFEPDPDEAMSKIEREMNKVQKYLPKVVNASDGAVEFAEEFGLNLDEIEGTGANSKIVKADVMAFLESGTPDVDDTEPVNQPEDAPEVAPEAAPEVVAPPVWFHDPEVEDDVQT